ncbi:hypothetical protein H5410_062005 [Solanum commersonii]|uniref:Uncharacterized protein n=1 Tax=Solanum commersonii TaxID=4109 RepID=A0A9J5WA85_SOLCO|nr:hypothetical protein H5410_062005 [Solanum commersonii]
METGFLECDRNTVLKQVKSEESTRLKSKILELKPFESSRNVLRRITRLIHHRLALAFSIVMFWIIGRHSTTSRNYLVIPQLLLFTFDLIRSFRAQHTGTKGEDKTFWHLAEWVRRFSDLHLFVLLAAFVPFFLSSVYAFPQTPNT